MMGSIGSSVGGDVGGRRPDGADRRQHASRDGHRGVEPAEQIGAGIGDTRGRCDGDGRGLHPDRACSCAAAALNAAASTPGASVTVADGDVGAGKRQPEVEPVRELVDAIGGEKRRRAGPRRRERRRRQHRRCAAREDAAARQDTTTGEDATAAESTPPPPPPVKMPPPVMTPPPPPPPVKIAPAARDDAAAPGAPHTAPTRAPAAAPGHVVGILHARGSLGRRSRRRDHALVEPGQELRRRGEADPPTEARTRAGDPPERRIDGGVGEAREARTSAASVVHAGAPPDAALYRRGRREQGVGTERADAPLPHAPRSRSRPSWARRSASLARSTSPTCRHASAMSCSSFSWMHGCPEPGGGPAAGVEVQRREPRRVGVPHPELGRVPHPVERRGDDARVRPGPRWRGRRRCRAPCRGGCRTAARSGSGGGGADTWRSAPSSGTATRARVPSRAADPRAPAGCRRAASSSRPAAGGRATRSRHRARCGTST